MKTIAINKSVTWFLRGAVVLGGLTLAACAPIALPGEGAQPASNGVALDASANQGADDTLTQTPEATHTAQPGMTETSGTPDASQTPEPGVTAVAGQEVEFVGTIESFDGGVLVVSGRKVVITAQTEVKFQPQKGLNVKVHGTVQADGSILAREIESVPDGLATHQPDLTRTPRADETREPRGTHAANETEFTGTVSSINGNVYVVNGVTVIVAGEVKGAIVAGDTVKVHGVTQSDGTVLAREIEKVGADDQGDDIGDDKGGHHGSDDMTPVPTTVGSDDHGGSDDQGGSDDHGGSGGGSDDGGNHGGDDNGGHGGDDKNP